VSPRRRRSALRWTRAPLVTFALALALLVPSLAVAVIAPGSTPVGLARVLGFAQAVPAGPRGTSAIRLPRGFRPIAHYTQLVRDYSFAGARLPSDWSSGTWNYGLHATQFQPSQVAMTGSSVALTAVRGRASQGLPYKSGWIMTQGRFTLTYGMIDFRARVPPGQGLWPGLWLCNPAGVEIDAGELLMGQPHLVYGSLHDGRRWDETQADWLRSGASRRYHDYEVVWQPGMVTWAVDGVAYAQYTRADARSAGDPWPFDGASGMYLIADLGVGSAGEWAGPPDAATRFPAVMRVRAIRVWR